MHVGADVALRRQERCAGVQTHPHGQCELLLGLPCSRERTRRGWKGDEKRVTLRVDLDATVAGERVAEYDPVLR